MTAPLQPWLSRDQLEAEIRSLRQAHNFAPAGILNDLVWGIRTEVLEMDFDRALQKMTPEARSVPRQRCYYCEILASGLDVETVSRDWGSLARSYSPLNCAVQVIIRSELEIGRLAIPVLYAINSDFLWRPFQQSNASSGFGRHNMR